MAFRRTALQVRLGGPTRSRGDHPVTEETSSAAPQVAGARIGVARHHPYRVATVETTTATAIHPEGHRAIRKVHTGQVPGLAQSAPTGQRRAVLLHLEVGALAQMGRRPTASGATARPALTGVAAPRAIAGRIGRPVALVRGARPADAVRPLQLVVPAAVSGPWRSSGAVRVIL